MKKNLLLILITTSILLITGCGGAEADEPEKTETAKDDSKKQDNPKEKEQDDPVVNHFPNAVLYTLQDDATGFINDNPNHDEDVYKMSVTKTGTYTISIEMLTGTKDTSGSRTLVHIYDKDEKLIGSIFNSGELDKPGDWYRETFEVIATGDIYVKINRDYQLPAKYSFNIQPSIANGLIQDTNNEPNHVKVQATPITWEQASTEINGSINITANHDTVDYFKLPLTKTGTYTITMELLTGTTDSDSDETGLFITDEYGTELVRLYDNYEFDKPGDWDRKTFEVVSAGDIYISLSRYNNLAAKYTFNIQPSIANGLIQDTNNEPNHVKAQATPITWEQVSTEINGSINMTAKDDTSDYFKLPVTKTGSYTITMEMLSGTTDTDGAETGLFITDEYGTELVKLYDNYKLDKSGDWNRKTFEVGSAGNLYISLSRYYNLAAKYSFHIEPSIANGLVQDSNNEPNNYTAQATPITWDQISTEVNGSINMTDRTDLIDYYKVTLTKTGTYTISMEMLSGTTDTDGAETGLFITDEYGTELIKLYDNYKLDKSGDTNSKTFVVASSRTVYIRVTRYNNLAAHYSFTLTAP